MLVDRKNDKISMIISVGTLELDRQRQQKSNLCGRRGDMTSKKQKAIQCNFRGGETTLKLITKEKPSRGCVHKGYLSVHLKKRKSKQDK